MCLFKDRSSETIEKQLIDLKKTIDFLNKETKLRFFICYGTLLGAIRNKDVIKKDNDFDIVYLSNKNNVQDVRKELKELCIKLINKNLLAKIWIKGKHIKNPKVEDLDLNFIGQMHIMSINKAVAIDVFTSWIDKNNDINITFRIYNKQLKKDDIVPFKLGNIRDVYFPIPNNSKKVIKEIYGNDWNIPQQKKSKNKRKHLWEFK